MIYNDILVSVVMPMYNSEAYIAEALESLQKQTYTNFEVIIIDNCSTDHSVDIVRKFNDRRFHLYCNDRNQGLLYSLQRGVLLAKGKYVARLDSDDVSYPERLEKQVEFLETHSKILLCGCECNHIRDGKIVEREKFPIYGSEAIKFSLLYGDYCIAHSTFMFRRLEMQKMGICYEKFQHCQDYHMLLSVIYKAEVEMLPETLVGYRIHPDQLSQIDSDDFVENEEIKIRKLYLEKIGMNTKQQAILCKAVLKKLCGYKEIFEFQNLMKVHAKIIEVDINKCNTFQHLCAQYIFWHVCTMQERRTKGMLLAYLKSPFRNLKWLLGTKEGIMWAICCFVGYNVKGCGKGK